MGFYAGGAINLNHLGIGGGKGLDFLGFRDQKLSADGDWNLYFGGKNVYNGDKVQRDFFDVDGLVYDYSYEKKRITHMDGSVDIEKTTKHQSLILSLERIETKKTVITRLNIEIGLTLGIVLVPEFNAKFSLITEINR